MVAQRDNLGDKLMKGENFEQAIDEIIWLITLLANQPILIHNYRNPEDQKPLLTPEEMELFTTPVDLSEYKDAIMNALNKGIKRNVVSEADTKKRGSRVSTEELFTRLLYYGISQLHLTMDEVWLMLTILASYAQEESRSASENQKWRIKKNFEEGMPWNGRMLGYRMRDGQYYIIPDEAEIVHRVYREYLSGMGPNRIAAGLTEDGIPTMNGGLWQPQTIAKMLRNYSYTGNLLLQKTFCENHITKKMLKNIGQRPRYLAEETHEAIIPMEEWQAVQAEIERRANSRKSTPPVKPTFFYTGLIQCAKCGKNYRRKTTATQIVWICATFNTRGKKYCASKQIPESTLDALVAEVVRSPADIEKIIADDGNTLHFHLADGSVVTRIWADRSRAESWTAEKREVARQQAYERRQTKWQEQSQ